MLRELHPSLSFSGGPHHDGPPNAREALWSGGQSPGWGASGGGSLQLEKSSGGRSSGGATYPDIPATVVLGVAMPPEEAVTPYPSTAPLSGSMTGREPAGRLPCMCTRDPGGSSSGRILML